jgi:hypothetical protein
MKSLLSLAAALATLAVAAPAATADTHPPDAEIFATSNTAVITDPADPRLNARLDRFARAVTDIIDEGGGEPRGSELLDGVFFDSGLGTTTFERSRRFDVDRVDDAELHDIAETIRRRFLHGAVLTFDHLPPSDPDADAIELDVPHVTAQALRDGLLADPTARERLFGGSVTQDRHLLLVADRADTDLATDFAERIGGDVRRAATRYGEREFVAAATDGRARLEHRTLVITGTPDPDTLAVRARQRLEIDFGDDGAVDFEPSLRRFDRIRVETGDGDDAVRLDVARIPTAVDGGDGYDALTLEGSDDGDAFEVSDDDGHASTGRAEVDATERIDLAGKGGADRVTVDDLTGTDVLEVHTDLGAGDLDRAVVNCSNGPDNQTTVLGFAGTVFVLGPTFVQIENAEPTDRLRLNGRGGDDELITATGAMTQTLDGGDGVDFVLGGPGDDTLIGGDDFDDIAGRKGDDTAYMGRSPDRFSWDPGDGNDTVDGQSGHDSMFFTGTADPETFDLSADRRRLRFARDVGNIVMDLDDVEEIDTIAFGGADVFNVGDLRRTAVTEVNASLAGSFGTAVGDGARDRVNVEGTERADAITVTGKTLFSGAVTVGGLPIKVGITHAEGALDTLAIHTLAGDDTVDSSGLEPGTIALEVD